MIQAEKKVQKNEETLGSFKKVGLAEFKVLAVNPDLEEVNSILGTSFENETIYLKEDKEGNTQFDLVFYVKDVKSGFITTLKISLINKFAESSKGKVRFIDSKGNTSYWIDSEENLPKFMQENSPWQARVGECQLYEFLKAYLNSINWKSLGEFTVSWKDLMKGKTGEIQELIDGEFAESVVLASVVETWEKDGETKSKSLIYPYAFTPGYRMKMIRNLKPTVNTVEEIKARDNKGKKDYENFLVNILGCKGYYSFDELKDYNPDDNLVESDKVLDTTSADY